MYLLVGNPTAQSGRNRERIDRARELMDARGLRHEFLATSPAGGTVRDVVAAITSGRFQTVVAMGGDGTFAEVAKGILESHADVTMGLLPTGTANDQGRSFGLSAAPAALPRNVEVLAEGHVAPVDAGRVRSFDDFGNEVGQDWFFDSMGWGLSARVLRQRNEDRELVQQIPIVREVYRDQLVYAGAVLRTFLESYVDELRFEAEVETEHGVRYLTGLTDLIVKNTRYYAGAWVFDATASPEDGEMELVPLTGRHELIKRMVVQHEQFPVPEQDLDPLLQLSPITRARAFHIRIDDRPLAAPVEAQIDGEEFPRASAYRIEVVRHALKLLTPPIPELA